MEFKMMEVSPGEKTTEYNQLQSSNVYGWITVIIGVIVAVGPQLLSSMQPNSQAAIWAGTIIAVAGILQKTLTTLGYNKGRADEKVAVIKANSLMLQTQFYKTREPIKTERTYDIAAMAKGSQLYDNYTILTKMLGHSSDEAKDIVSRLEKQTLRSLEIQAQADSFKMRAFGVKE